MEGYYNGVHADALSKKDKKRATIHAKLSKLDESLRVETDYYYSAMLEKLQQQLTSAHAGNNEEILEHVRDFEEERDQELVRLALWEQFEVERAEKEFFENVEEANKEHDEMVKLVKERLYASLERQVKQLKEDKVLLDVANSHSYSMAMEPLAGTHEFQKHTRSQQKEKEKDHQPLAAIGYLSDRRGLRRRAGGILNGGGHATGGESGNEDSHLSANDSGNNSGTAKRTRIAAGHGNGAKYSSAEESWLSDAGDLSSLLFGERRSEKQSTRHSSKSYSQPQGLRNEEVQDDLVMLKELPK